MGGRVGLLVNSLRPLGWKYLLPTIFGGVRGGKNVGSASPSPASAVLPPVTSAGGLGCRLPVPSATMSSVLPAMD